MDDIFEKMNSSIDRTQIHKLPKEEHGELISIAYISSSSGMMFNSDTLNSLTLERDGEHAKLTVREKQSGGGTETSVYKAELSLFDKLRAIIDRENVAAWSALKYVELFQVMDYSSSEGLTLIFDDSSIGGSRRAWRDIDCKAVEQQAHHLGSFGLKHAAGDAARKIQHDCCKRKVLYCCHQSSSALDNRIISSRSSV